MHRQQTIKPKKLWKRKSVKGPDITDDFEDPVVVTENAEIVAIRRLKKMMLNNTWSHTEVTNLVRRGSVLVLTTPFLSTVTMMLASSGASSFRGYWINKIAVCAF